jgi:nicotinic acid mononucleotide adenylyltransferase
LYAEEILTQDISSTLVRKRIKNNGDIKDLISPEITLYIEKNKLYR